jgi:hypothetical protein
MENIERILAMLKKRANTVKAFDDSKLITPERILAEKAEREAERQRAEEEAARLRAEKEAEMKRAEQTRIDEMKRAKQARVLGATETRERIRKNLLVPVSTDLNGSLRHRLNDSDNLLYNNFLLARISFAVEIDAESVGHVVMNWDGKDSEASDDRNIKDMTVWQLSKDQFESTLRRAPFVRRLNFSNGDCDIADEPADYRAFTSLSFGKNHIIDNIIVGQGRRNPRVTDYLFMPDGIRVFEMVRNEEDTFKAYKRINYSLINYSFSEGQFRRNPGNTTIEEELLDVFDRLHMVDIGSLDIEKD